MRHIRHVPSLPWGPGPRRTAVRALVVLLVLATGAACSTLGAPGPDPGDARAVQAKAALQQTPAERAAAARKWGVEQIPLLPPLPPAVKTHPATPDWAFQGADLIPAFGSVPTTDKVVFLTIDDGGHKDPEFLQMVRDLHVPFTMFLTDENVGGDYHYFNELRALGNSIQNHTLKHPQLNHESYERQREEICGQQDILERETGTRPRLFRPPYGDFDHDTLAIAEECGVQAAPLWAEEAFADRIDYREDDARFHPGDIILTHFNGPEEWNGSMGDMLRLVLRKATEQGYALARLDDYV
ncbi:polysaccharide deacetylase family protein [Streptomyces gamaensis]|uniref:Polysaccharide deacetylase family protein n=1 Tax=Streptomyces gamaensis TaxID=1763542 RepID=A0ABW0Z8M5_9ACTN